MHPPTEHGLQLFLAAAIADSPRHGKCCYSCCCGGDHFGSAIVRYSQKGCIKGQYILPKNGVSQEGNFLLKMGAPKVIIQCQNSRRSSVKGSLSCFSSVRPCRKRRQHGTIYIRLVGMCLSNADAVVCHGSEQFFFDTSSSSSFASVRNSSLSLAETV